MAVWRPPSTSRHPKPRASRLPRGSRRYGSDRCDGRGGWHRRRGIRGRPAAGHRAGRRRSRSAEVSCPRQALRSTRSSGPRSAAFTRSGQKTKEMLAEAHEQVNDIVAEVHAEGDVDQPAPADGRLGRVEPNCRRCAASAARAFRVKQRRYAHWQGAAGAKCISGHQLPPFPLEQCNEQDQDQDESADRPSSARAGAHENSGRQGQSGAPQADQRSIRRHSGHRGGRRSTRPPAASSCATTPIATTNSTARLTSIMPPTALRITAPPVGRAAPKMAPCTAPTPSSTSSPAASRQKPNSWPVIRTARAPWSTSSRRSIARSRWRPATASI